MTRERKITVNALTRVEGEGALHVRLDGQQIEDVRLSIYEPPRFFEALLRNRAIEEVPDITARICGICPVAYQMTSAQALERALGIRVSSTIGKLRRLLYCGEWIESHALHIFMLNAPDFFDCHSGIELAKKFPQQINDGLRLKQIGNRILEILGGRAIHPINLRVGGFYRLPGRDELAKLLPDLRWAIKAATRAADWIASFDFPSFQIDCELVALSHGEQYAIREGRIASTRFPTIDVDDYEHHFSESQVEHSTALHSSRRDSQSPYFLGPLARVTLNRRQLSPSARALALRLYPEHHLRNRFRSIVARIIEIVHAIEESISIIESYRPAGNPFVKYSPRAGFGCAATEAPRGMIYHHYQITRDGRVADSKIVPPTSQNQLQIESDLRSYLPALLDQPDDMIAAECEKLIRTYDPCISCSTHFLTLTMERT
ncbi:MAG: Ni/Fe hydrogenase subunit alpha [Pirellulales bacterium]|nr:Ni/Fe hydrogenase subunit alpha [Pirellulales bacterium]